MTLAQRAVKGNGVYLTTDPAFNSAPACSMHGRLPQGWRRSSLPGPTHGVPRGAQAGAPVVESVPLALRTAERLETGLERMLAHRLGLFPVGDRR